jgi:hypothetical protein
MTEKISIQIDSNERGSDRANGLILAAAKDSRFSMPSFAELDVDVCFSLAPDWPGCEGQCGNGIGFRPSEHVAECNACSCLMSETKRYLVELKEIKDYIISALATDGQLYQQYLSMAEAGEPCMILVLGSDDDIAWAIRHALEPHYSGQDLVDMCLSYEKRLIHFESSCEALGCPVERWDAMPYTRLLSRVATRLLGSASLMDYRPRPVEGEREVAALSILLGNGIGPAKAAAVLEKFSLILESKNEIDRDGMLKFAYELTDCAGIGPKLADRIRKRIEVVE